MRATVLAVCVVVVAAGCGSDNPSLRQDVEEAVRSGYERQIQEEAPDANIIAVDCVVRKEQADATCVAQVDGDPRGEVELEVKIGDDDRIVWKPVSLDLEPAPPS